MLCIILPVLRNCYPDPALSLPNECRITVWVELHNTGIILSNVSDLSTIVDKSETFCCIINNMHCLFLLLYEYFYYYIDASADNS